MNKRCPKCRRVYDDAQFTNTCPDHPPIDRPGAKYCQKHDFFDCPICIDAIVEKEHQSEHGIK